MIIPRNRLAYGLCVLLAVVRYHRKALKRLKS